MAASGSFEEFYAGTAGRLLGQLFLVTGDLHAAEEIVQEAFTRASVRWTRLRDYDVPEAWVRRVAMNLAADRARGLRRQAAAILRLGPPPAVPSVSVETLALVQALRSLPVRQRQAIVLHYLVDLPVQEVAHILAVRGGTVKSLLAGGRRSLAAKLGEPEEVFGPRMSDLRERLQEAAEAAAREGRIPDAAAVVKGGRRRRVRLLGSTAVLVVVAVVAGVVGVDWFAGRPAPLSPTPTSSPTTTRPSGSTVPAQVWIPSVTPLQVRARPGPYPGPDPGRIVQDVTSLVRGCYGTSRIRLWIRAQGKVWLVAAKPTPPGQARLCWAAGFMNQGGGGGLGPIRSQLRPLWVSFAGGGGNGELGVVGGAVTRRAVRLRVLFHKGRPLDLVPVDGGAGVPVNFFAGMFLGTGPPPAEHQRRESAVDRVVAFDQAGNQVAECRMRFGLGNTC